MLYLYAVPFGSNTTSHFLYFMMATGPVSPHWEESLRRLNEMTTLRKVEMLKEACEMLSGHAQQLEEMARILI